MRLVDLSVPVSSGMGHFEGTPPVYICKSHRIDECGYRMSLLVMGNHSGTHLDAPSHFVQTGEGLDSVPLERCLGPAVVCDFSAKAPGEPITIADFERHADEIGSGARVLVRTDWDERFGAEEYFADFPPLAPETAGWLAERDIWLLGVDTPSLNLEHAVPMHETLLGAGVVIVESLANLRELTQRHVLLSALPMKITGADGAPVRAVAYDGVPDGLR
ncbi:MAG: cyclase [Solirubrobacterales bacterium]|jgi:arylformamidase|nr:cyclase [Solirubrobacterales bacterium]